MAKPVLGKSVRSDWFLLGRDFARRTVSMETVQDVYFCFGVKPATSKFAITTAKKKVWTLSFFIAKLPEKAKKIEVLLRRRRTFSERVQCYREHLETFDSETETGITESQEAIDDFINQQKSANTNKKKATNMTKKPLWNFRINN